MQGTGWISASNTLSLCAWMVLAPFGGLFVSCISPPLLGVFSSAHFPGLHILAELGHIAHYPPTYTDRPDASPVNHIADGLRSDTEKNGRVGDGFKFLIPVPLAVRIILGADFCKQLPEFLAKVLPGQLVNDSFIFHFFCVKPSIHPAGMVLGLVAKVEDAPGMLWTIWALIICHQATRANRYISTICPCKLCCKIRDYARFLVGFDKRNFSPPSFPLIFFNRSISFATCLLPALWVKGGIPTS